MRITRDLDITLSPVELAEMFWDMTSAQQAEFFHNLGELPGNLLEMQMISVGNEQGFTHSAKKAMLVIGQVTETANSPYL